MENRINNPNPTPKNLYSDLNEDANGTDTEGMELDYRDEDK